MIATVRVRVRVGFKIDMYAMLRYEEPITVTSSQ